MAEKLILTFNAGSSTVKLGLFALDGSAARRIGKGVIDFHDQPLTFHLSEGPAVFNMPLTAQAGDDLNGVLNEVFAALGQHFDLNAIAIIGHRVVHGGDRFTRSMLLDDTVETGISDLIPLAPLHQPQSLRLIRAIRHLRPNIPQAVSFDTAFHQTNSDLVRRFAIPRALHDDGIKRYGFHGLSYQFIAGQLLQSASDIGGKKVVVAHLGSGASLCGLDGGTSRDTSMSFTALDGIPMGTRSGAIDPGVLLHLLTHKQYAAADIEDLLYHRSGLLGVSGLSSDTRDLVASQTLEADQALDLFALRIAGETARITNTLNGLDAFVFTAGIGEHQPEIRKRVADQLEWLGIKLDHAANEANAMVISTSQSRVKVLVVPTDEEQVIATEAAALLDTEF